MWLGGALSLLMPCQPQVPVFAASTELVYVVVNVNLQSGEPVGDLDIADFVIKEDGKSRQIASFTRVTDTRRPDKKAFPVEVALLLDTSPSMRPNLTPARDITLQLLKDITGVAARHLVTFDSAVRVWAFNGAHPEGSIDDALLSVPGMGSRLFDALMASVNLFGAGESRRIIVGLTDGLDQGSRASRDRAQKALQDQGVTFYAVSFAEQLPGVLVGGLDQAGVAAGHLRSLASSTGGFVAEGTAKDINAQFARIRTDISTQYVLGFEPSPSKSGKRHRLDVEVRRAGARVRHRREYKTPARPAVEP
jgi:VWFA-related protein